LSAILRREERAEGDNYVRYGKKHRITMLFGLTI